jgi:hypothetical protein
MVSLWLKSAAKIKHAPQIFHSSPKIFTRQSQILVVQAIDARALIIEDQGF